MGRDGLANNSYSLSCSLKQLPGQFRREVDREQSISSRDLPDRANRGGKDSDWRHLGEATRRRSHRPRLNDALPVLNLSVETVKDHVAAVLRALNVNSRTQAVLAVSQMPGQGATLPWLSRPAH